MSWFGPRAQPRVQIVGDHGVGVCVEGATGAGDSRLGGTAHDHCSAADG